MKAVLLSIKPEWCKLMASGRKTVEVRKNEPKLSKPFKCFIYCTMPNPTHQKDVVEIAGKRINGKVWAEFTCFNIEPFTTDYRRDEEQTMRLSKKSCVSYEDLAEYEQNAHCLFGWHISDLKIYDQPKPLSYFSKHGFSSLFGTNVCGNEDYEHYEPSGDRMVPPTCGLNGYCSLHRPPQSWCYVEELKDETILPVLLQRLSER